MGRRLLAAGAVVAVVLAAACWFQSAPPVGSSRPNVIIYLVDTLRADHLGVFGYSRDTSPVLDRWAADAVVFEQAYSPTSWTKSATVSLLSGLDPINHRVEDRLDVIPPRVRLLSERLDSLGYENLAVVTNPNVLPLWGFDRGFDVYRDLDSIGRSARADAVLDTVTAAIPDLARKQPFFLYVHLLDPHDPYDPPPPFDSRFAEDPAVPGSGMIAAYDGEVAFGDSQFQRLLDALKAHDLDEVTLIVFVSDHGEELLDHGGRGHGKTLYEEVLRVPLVIGFPGRADAGRRVDTRVSLIDVVPTILSVLGEPPLPDLDGRDLTALLGDEEPAWADRDLFLSLDLAWKKNRTDAMRGVFAGSQKYLRRLRPAADEMLFDIEGDPGETLNLAELQVESRSRLAGRLDVYLATRSSGVHLRILNDHSRQSVGCEAVLSTTGRFIEVSGQLLEARDRLDLSQDGRTLRLHCRLQNQPHPTRGVPAVTADEDGLVFSVSPPHAPIVVEQLSLADGRSLELRVGLQRQVAELPFRLDGTDGKWGIRDVAELFRELGDPPEPAPMGAYLAVVSPPPEREEIPDEVQDRLRALGYLDEAREAE
jgi:arylsulfatase A-like enzyme